MLTRRLKTFSMDETVHNGLVPIAVNKQVVYEKEYRARKCSKYSGYHVRDLRYIGAGFSEEDSMSGYHKSGCKGANIFKSHFAGFEFWDGVDPDQSKSILLDVAIPMSCKSIRYGFLVDVSFILSVSVFPKGG